MSVEMLEFFKTQGPWALLFVALFYWVLREQKKREEQSGQREEKLIAIVNEQNANFTKMSTNYEQLAGYVKEIATTMERRRSPRDDQG